MLKSIRATAISMAAALVQLKLLCDWSIAITVAVAENNAMSNSKVPATVLVHGGGCTEKSVRIYYHCYGGLSIIHFSFFVYQYYA
jgi:hypothetical protein